MTAFADRHIGTTIETQRTMLEALGLADADMPVEALMHQAVPSSILTVPTGSSVIPPAATEAEALAELRGFAARNTVNTSMIGMGYYGTITPSVIQRNVLENPSWYTAYTPTSRRSHRGAWRR